MDVVKFNIHCGECGQQLAPSGSPSDLSQAYKHENASECDGHEVEVPIVTVDQLAALFKSPAKKKAAPRKAAKK